MWRPKEGWNNPFHKTGDFEHGWMAWNEQLEFSAYEAGADAMLEALKKEGQYWGKFVAKPAFNTTKIGWLVFIEETE